MSSSDLTSRMRQGAGVPATPWSAVVSAAGKTSTEALSALDRLCGIYWPPLYAYVRRVGHNPEDAKDLTQAFFARFLKKKYVRRADPEQGRFRSFLLTSLQRFLRSEWRR